MLQVVLLSLCLALTVSSDGRARLGPVFTVEPASEVRFAASSGARVHCTARGEPPPRLQWLADDGTVLVDAPGIRRVYSNGTLEVFGAYRGAAADTGGSLVRCRATNAHGTLLSRDVHLLPVSDVNWEARVVAGSVAAGGVAALECRAAPALAAPALWYRSDQVLHIDPPTPDSRYLVAGDMLLIRDASPVDAGDYSCLARHALTALTKRSRPAPLAVTPGSSSSAPRLVSAAGEVSVRAGADFCLPCVASDYPLPQYTWYRERSGRLQPVESGGGGGGGVWTWAGGAALCFTRAPPDAGGAYLCKAYNVFGDATAQMRLDVQDTLAVTVAPSVLIAEAGSTVRFNCSVSDSAAVTQWLHDGAALAGVGLSLTLRVVSRSHAGIYQCVARSGRRSAQASAELRLGDSPPELQYTFIEQALRAGGRVTLRCAAAAAPPPRLAWLLDGQPLEQYLPHHRYSISEEQSVSGEVVSVLNVSATAADGGRYTCRAHNHLGAVEHSARLNIYGPPSIRAVSAVRAVAGDNITVHCPYAGYPISSVTWWRRGASAAVGAGGRVSARGGALRLAPALAHDAGHYACAVAAPPAPTATRDIEIQVRNPPKISPFLFSSELTEGSSAQVLCGVSSGDKPIYFSWLKDAAPLPPNLQIEEKSLNEFSLLMFSDLTARHSGDYTCRVSNHAATVNYTATLTVKVAPSWVSEPLDAAVLVGAPLLLECAARGFPTPTVVWYRNIGGSTNIPDTERWEATGSEWGPGALGPMGATGSSGTSGTSGASGANGASAVSGGEGVGRGALTSRSAARSHQGQYRCTADNGVGPPLVKQVNVTVHEPAHFAASEQAANVSSVRGRGATLACTALGDAPLQLHWTHAGRTLDLHSYRWSISETRTGAGVRSTLQLRAAERGDAGQYRCHAANQFGRADLLLYLHVEEPPEAPRAVRLDGAGARWVRVQWAASPAPPASPALYQALATPLHALPDSTPDASHAHNLTVEHVDDSSTMGAEYRTLSAMVTGLRPAVAYSLRLVAANHVGHSPQSDALLFTTLEEIPSGSPQNVRVRPINTGELHVSWSAPPQDTWNGELLGYVVSWRELSRLGADGGGVEGEGHEGDGGRGEEGARAGSASTRGWGSAELALGGLRAFARYAISARAFNRAGAGPHSPTVYANTADGVPEQPPQGVSCEATSPRSLRVRWRPPRDPSAPSAPAAPVPPLAGYDVHFAPLHFSHAWSGAVGSQTARAAGGEALLQGLRAATNYSVAVSARSARGLGPPSPPVYCTTQEDVPGAVEAVRAVAAAADAVRVAWLPPPGVGAFSHYTLYTRELGKVGGEWSQRVEASGDERGGERGDEREDERGEVSHEVRGLRARAVYEFWVRAASAAGAGPPSRAVTAGPAKVVSARIWSMGRVVSAGEGTRVRLRCAAVGAPPLARRWAPLPHSHTITDTGDLIIHKLTAAWAGNYTCSVRNVGGGDAVTFAVRLLTPPAPPDLRLTRADTHTLHLTWDQPHDGGAPILGYTVWWWRGWATGETGGGGGGSGGRSVRWGGDAGSGRAGSGALTLRGLACGAPYRVTARAHNALGASPHSRALLLRTRGDKAKAPPGKECIWANSSSLRVNLLAWGGGGVGGGVRCPVAIWEVAMRRTSAPRWTELRTDGESAEAGELEAGTWYEIRVVARAPAGDTHALYRAATHTLSGERLGEPIDLPLEARMSVAESEGEAEAAAWRGWGAALAGGLLAALLALALAAAACRARARPARDVRGARDPPPPPLYVAEPHINGKTLSPPDGDLHEISPYATFSMSSGTVCAEGSGALAGAGPCAGGGGVAGAGGTGRGRGAEEAERGCALHLHSFARAPHELAAPPRPHLLSQHNDYGRGVRGDSDSESSGSPCAACAAELYRLPASDTLPLSAATESSAEDASYGGGGGGGGGGRRARDPRHTQRARRREHAPHQPTVRYFSSGSVRRAAL